MPSNARDIAQLLVSALNTLPMSPTACGFSAIISSNGNGVSAVVTLAGAFTIVPAFSFPFFAVEGLGYEGAFGLAVLWVAAVVVALSLAVSAPEERGRRFAGGGPFVGFVMIYLVLIFMLSATMSVVVAQ